MKWKVRQETDADAYAIAAVIDAAFAGKPYAGGNEAAILGRLRTSGALVLSLVATAKNKVIGHVALSPAKVGGNNWLALGPVAVAPDCQCQGVGSQLISTALAVAENYGRAGVVLMGDPQYYERFGFAVAGDLTIDGRKSNHLQIICFGDEEPTGDAYFHSAFDDC